jgi:hypothetical protein
MMRMKQMTFAAAVVLAFACSRERVAANGSKPAPRKTTTVSPTDMHNQNVRVAVAPVPIFLEACGMGSTLAADGTVTGEMKEVAPGGPLYLTMRFRDSPEGLQSRIEVRGHDKKLLDEQRREMKGAKVVTFEVPRAKITPGEKLHIEGYWGGNIACESDVAVTKKK